MYAPWCGWCKKLAPVWEELAQIHKNNKEINIANVNADTHNTVMLRFGVSGFPSLVLVENGKYTLYKGERTIDAFNQFIKDGQATTPVNTKEIILQSFQKRNRMKSMQERKEGKKKIYEKIKIKIKIKNKNKK